MKFLHIADLHIGKRVHERSMLEEQRHAFNQIVALAKAEQVDAVLIAGDVFDRPQPPREALEECERLYAGLIATGAKVFVIPGNHDSAQQVAFCSSITAAAGLHIARAYRGDIACFRLEDEAGPVDIHLLPFVRPTDVRVALPERADEIRSHDDAVRIALEEHEIDANARNVLVAHQFVVDGTCEPATCESESVSVGGIDSVQAANFDAFDYVALGHLHGPQQVRRPQVRYSGSPVRYSFSEANQRKVACVVELKEDGATYREVELEPIHRMREVVASFEELAAGLDTQDHNDYMRIVLTDMSLYDAMNKVRALYPNLMALDWQRARDGGRTSHDEVKTIKAKSITELFGEFYQEQTETPLSEEARELFAAVVDAQEVSA